MTRGDAVTYAGWVFKEGSLVRSWKKRFLVAKGADLAYYKNTDKENHAQLLGALTAARIERLPDITNGLLIIGSEGRLLKIFTDTRAESDKCFAAIARYCRDQNRYGGGGGGEAQRQPSAGGDGAAAKQRVGWLEKEGQHFKTWKKRYFVLNGNRLTYSANIGGETLGAGKVVGARRDPSRPFTLSVTFEGGREMRIGGKSEFDIDDWHKAMRRGILHAHDQHRPSQSQSRASEDEQFFRDSEDTGSVPPPVGAEDVMTSPLFGSAPSTSSTSFASASSSDLPPPPPYSSVEEEQPAPVSEEEALRHQRAFDRELDAAASFRRHIVVEVAEDNTASFVEVEPERESSEKPFSPTPPGTATIRRMRLAEMLLQEELEEERKEALMKETTMNRPAGTPSGPDPDVKGPCCCVVM